MTASPFTLNELQKDSLTELFNLGVGQAAAQLSEMTQEEVHLNTPNVEILTISQAADMVFIQGEGEISAVEQDFDGGFNGVAMLVFPRADSLELVRRILHTQLPAEQLSELESDALVEVGNIILNSCFSCISDMLEISFHSSLPQHLQGDPAQIFAKVSQVTKSQYILVLYVQFELPSHNVKGSLNFFMSLTSLVAFVHSLDEYLERVL